MISDFQKKTRRITFRVEAGYNDDRPRDYVKELNIYIPNDMGQDTDIVYVHGVNSVARKISRLLTEDMKQILDREEAGEGDDGE